MKSGPSPPAGTGDEARMNDGDKKWNDLSEAERGAGYDALAGRPFWHDEDGRPYEVSPRRFAKLCAKEQGANAETAALARMPLGDAWTAMLVKCYFEFYAGLFGDSGNDASARRAGAAGHATGVAGGV